jgi:hypothetical protein
VIYQLVAFFDFFSGEFARRGCASVSICLRFGDHTLLEQALLNAHSIKRDTLCKPGHSFATLAELRKIEACGLRARGGIFLFACCSALSPLLEVGCLD